MKIRTDFVTNSSSSSFVVFGVDVEDLDVEIPEFNEDGEEFDGAYEFFNAKVDGTPLEYSAGPYGDEGWVGISPTSLEGKFKDQLLGNIRQIVADEINKVFGTNLIAKNIVYIEEAWMDN